MSFAAAALALALALPTQGGGEPSTTVSAPRPADIDDARGDLAGDALALQGPEDALSALGATLVHDGGPLAPSRVMVRGLGGARLALSFDDVALGDPTGAHLDAALLPWAFADSLVVDSGPGAGLGGAVRLSSAAGAPRGGRARLLVGALDTVRLSGQASTPLPEGWLRAGAELASTRGDFAFNPVGAAGGDTDELTLVRVNNDRQRATALVDGATRWGPLQVDGLLLAAGHRGGIPGFALAPTRSLRGEDGLLAGRVGARVVTGSASLGASLSGRGVHRATEGPADPRSAVQSSAATLAVTATRVPLGDEVIADIETHASTTGARADAQRFERLEAGARVAARTTLGPVRLRLHADGRALTDAGPLFGGELRVEAGDTVRGSLSLARASRAPTLEELYAPAGFLRGNAALKPELAHDLEGAVAFQPGRLLAARAVAFAGRLDEAIVYLNDNAYEVAPHNTGTAWRAGLDVFMTLEVLPWCGLEAALGALASRLDATGAPLPLAPPWSSRGTLRLGPLGGPQLAATLRARGPVSSNHFGTLVAPAQALVDVVARAPLTQHLWASAALTNALDARDARDQNQLPLPGRLWSLALEVSP